MNVNRKELLAALKTATRVTPKRSARPSLQCVLLESAGPILYIKATDLETYFRTYIDGTGGPDRGFRVLVNAKDARDLVKAFRGETIEVLDIVDSFDARLGSGTLRGEDPDLLPELPTAEETDFAFAVAGPDFKRMVTEVAFAAAREDSRYSVNGILIERRDNTLRFVATDGRRLSVSQLHYMDGVELKAIVPAIPMGYIRMALGKRDLVDVHVDGVNVRFSWGNNLMVIRQLENRFPEYSAVIPKDLPVRAYIEREPLISALDALKPFSSGDVDAVRFEVSGNLLALSAKDPEKGEGTQALIVNGSGEGAMALNPTYLLQALKASEDDDVELKFIDDTVPVLWNLGFTYVQMPISGS
jgi:DNA polymerase-3 subunit beta